jgi:PAS domain S-box-containing protein
MSILPFETLRPFRRKRASPSVETGAVKNGVPVDLRLRDKEQDFELPARLFEQLPFAIYFCDRDGLVLRYNRRAAELWGRSPVLGDPDERFCGSYRMFRPDGSPLAHHQCPMADVLRTGVSVRQQEVHIERPDGSRGIALVDIEAIKDSGGNIVGAVNCFQDITERKRNDEHIATLAREAVHRTKNILATVQATVNLSRSDTADGLKRAIEGRIQALAKLHDLFVKSHWSGAVLSSIAAQELAPYRGEGLARVRIDGPHVLLAPNAAQAIAVTLHELATNAVKYGSLSVPKGQVEVTWSCTTDGRLTMHWAESGGPQAKKTERRGFGTSVIERMIREQLKGEMHLDWRTDGLACEIVLQTSKL